MKKEFEELTKKCANLPKNSPQLNQVAPILANLHINVDNAESKRVKKFLCLGSQSSWAFSTKVKNQAILLDYKARTDSSINGNNAKAKNLLKDLNLSDSKIVIGFINHCHTWAQNNKEPFPQLIESQEIAELVLGYNGSSLTTNKRYTFKQAVDVCLRTTDEFRKNPGEELSPIQLEFIPYKLNPKIIGQLEKSKIPIKSEFQNSTITPEIHHFIHNRGGGGF